MIDSPIEQYLDELFAALRGASPRGGSDCARWLRGYPHAQSCAQVALNDWAWETVAYWIALGVLGVVALALCVLVRRRWSRVRGWAPLPVTVVDTIATTLFGATGVWLTGLKIDAGQWLSAAPVALAAGLLFGLRLLRDVGAMQPLGGEQRIAHGT